MCRKLLYVLAFSVTACIVPEAQYVGKGCEADSDCPNNMRCQVTARGTGRVCEAIFIYEEPKVSTKVYYCDGVKAVMDKYCVACHGDTPANFAPPSFRLDVYPTTAGKPGVFDKAERVSSRTYTSKDMPPANFGLQPNDDERKLVYEWFASGGEECGPGGPAGGASDAGSTLVTPPGGGSPNLPPTVSLTNPPPNSQLYTGADAAATLIATAQDPEGQIARVEFYRDGTKIGEDTTAPYTFVWNISGAGNANVTARVFDAAGATGQSQGVPVTISAPPAGQVIWAFGVYDQAGNVIQEPLAANATLSLAATGAQSLGIGAKTIPRIVGSVRFDINGTVTASNQNTEPYCFGVPTGCDANRPVTPGTYNITATPYSAIDGGGTAGAARNITVTINN